MKKILSYATVLILLAGMGLGSCTGNFEEYNTNGESPEYGNVDPSTLLEQLISTGAYYIYERSWRVNNELMQYTVDCSAATDIQRYVFQVGEYKTPWERFQRYAANANHMIALAEKYEDPNAQAIAMTLKAVFMSLITDLYGDIPYKEAYRIDENITQPQIDPQSEIYAGLIDMLLEANSLYRTATDNNGNYTYPLTVPGKDLLYGGDIAAWQKFTNSLCLRLCMRLSNRPEAGSAAIMQTIVSNPAKHPVFSSCDDDAKVSYTGIAPFKNEFGLLHRPTAHHLGPAHGPMGPDDRFGGHPRRRERRGRAGRHGSQRDERLGAQAVHLAGLADDLVGGLLHPQRSGPYRDDLRRRGPCRAILRKSHYQFDPAVEPDHLRRQHRPVSARHRIESRL